MKHYNKETAKCKFCPRKFVTHKDLQLHMKGDHGYSNKKFICDICGYATEYKSALEKHINIKVSYHFLIKQKAMI